jgi:Uma2 family endonuclease
VEAHVSYALVESPHLISVEEYLATEPDSPVKREYVAGRVYAFAGGSTRHNRLSMRIGRFLDIAANDSGCAVAGSDQLLRAARDLYYYPDVTVVCDDDGFEGRITTKPCLLVEVLSSSTEANDRREKLVVYRNLPSLQAYLIVAQDQRKIELHYGDANSEWQQQEFGAGEAFSVPCPGAELSVDAIYRGIVE